MILVSIDFGKSLIIPILPCVHVATIFGCVDSEVAIFVVHAVVVLVVLSFINLLVYVVIDAIGAIPIFFRTN